MARRYIDTNTPKDIACSRCKQPRGGPCKRPSGHAVFGGGFHVERTREFEAMAMVKTDAGQYAIPFHRLIPTGGPAAAMPGKAAFTLSPAAADVLRSLEYIHTSTGDGVRINQQLERKLYEEVDAVLQRTGGRWDKNLRAHVFKSANSARQLIDLILASGRVPAANPHSFYATPSPIADKLIEHADLDGLSETGLILDPSCGEGALLARALDYVSEQGRSARLLGFELDFERYLTARKEFRTSVVWGDFLEATGPQADELVDRILMNPPFSARGAPLLWLDHVQHAITWLAPDGVLAAIVPAGFEYHRERRVVEFRAFVQMCGGWQSLPADAFKDSGTGVLTSVLWLRRQ